MNCPLCGSPSAVGVSLTTGAIVHASCYEELRSTWHVAGRQAATRRADVAAARSALLRRETYLGRVSRLLFGGEDAATIRGRLMAAEHAAKEAQRTRDLAITRAVPIFDLVMEYPPDWPLRAAAVHERDQVCVRCGSGSGLDTHHIVPLSRGGTNQLANLTLLCRECHSLTHGGRMLTYQSTADEPPAIAERVQVLAQAIDTQRDVEFMYRKPQDVVPLRRRVTPSSLVSVTHQHDSGSTLCLEGFCHLRQDIRVFALKRMWAVKSM